MRNIFVLTKREQRVVIVIVMLLVAASLAKHYLDIRLEPAPVESPSTASPSATPQSRLEDEEASDEAP
jgi:hypothetical protein